MGHITDLLTGAVMAYQKVGILLDENPVEVGKQLLRTRSTTLCFTHKGRVAMVTVQFKASSDPKYQEPDVSVYLGAPPMFSVGEARDFMTALDNACRFVDFFTGHLGECRVPVTSPGDHGASWPERHA